MNSQEFFRLIVNNPKKIILVSILLIGLFGIQISNLVTDTRADAFLSDENPALIYRDKVKQQFGLSDPIVIAVMSEGSIFTEDGLRAISLISEAVVKIPNVDPDGVISLSTEDNIFGVEEGMIVKPFYLLPIKDNSIPQKVRDAVREFPLYQGTLVARDESAALILVEILDDTVVEETYKQILDLAMDMQIQTGFDVHVAGEGAIAGYLGSYIDSDAKRLNPIAGVVITIIVFLAFLRFAPAFSANLIILASAAITVGTMALMQVPFYVITNALPVILIGISVADSIHIYSEYFERRRRAPQEPIHSSIVFAMVNMWRPITLTTLTTAAGFLGLYFAAYMPPFKMFGLYTAIGVSVAWIYSLVFLPAVMALFKTEVNAKLDNRGNTNKVDVFTKVMVAFGALTSRHAGKVILLSICLIALGIFSATRLVVNEDRIETFHPEEQLFIADKQINSKFNGTNFLDIVVETTEKEGLFQPEVLKAMEALQNYAESLESVNDSVSIVDYLKQMNRSLFDGNPDAYELPQDPDLIAQYFLLYSASGNPTDFEEEVDYDYQTANIRITLNTGAYVDIKPIVEELNRYIEHQFNNESFTAVLTGRVNLNYHWIKDLGASHFKGMAIALTLVWLVSSLLFKSPLAGLLSLIPVVTSILFVYTAMVALDINLGIGTSMFAAVAIGLGVDFAIHTLERLQGLYRQGLTPNEVMRVFYPTTGRALLFNLLAIALGFGVLISSKVVPLNNFGSIVAISVVTSFITSLALLPAIALKFRISFFVGSCSDKTIGARKSVATILAVSAFLALLFTSEDVFATEMPGGREVVEKVNSVNEGENRTANLTMYMTDSRGTTRTRETRSFRKFVEGEKWTVLFYLSPRNVRHTAFLTYDYEDSAREDDQWLYLPAMRKARRISASDRGDYFLGTDFTYEDIKKEGKFELSDYDFTTLAINQTTAKHLTPNLIKLEGIPKTQEIAEELGYGRFVAWIDTSNWIVVQAQYWDVSMNELKTLVNSEIRQVNGVWTRHKLSIQNHKTGHRTEFVFSDVDYEDKLEDSVFTRQALSRGAPR